jgi:hypothetical protein
VQSAQGSAEVGPHEEELMDRRLAALGLLAIGCGMPANDAHVPAEGPPPISGGTLEVTRDGLFAVVSDPDRASIHVVDLWAGEPRHRIVLEELDEPGRIVEDAEGLVHVVMRRSGDLVTIDVTTGEILERRDVCSAPRGIALDPDTGELVVACAEGALVRMPARGTEGTRVVRLDPDLRDVVALPGDRLMVSRFRSSEILWIEDGAIVHRARPPSTDMGGGRIMTSSVAWRLRPHGNGALLVHQQAQSTQLGVLGVPSGVYYGADCQLGVFRSLVSYVDADLRTFRAAAIDSASLVVDADAYGDFGRSRIALAAAADPGATADPSTFLLPVSGVRVVDEAALQPELNLTCTFADDPLANNESAVAIAGLPGGGFIAQFRDPLRLERLDGSAIELDAGPAFDRGHRLFHEAGVTTGATCAGCHPEGGDDGRVWLFDMGAKRTQTTTGGILATAPFHWDGQVENATQVYEGTFVGRMGGIMPRPDEIRSFERWVDRLAPMPGSASDDATIERGRAVFERPDVRCAECHNGERLTNNQTVDVGTGGRVQVPALYEVVYHAPYFHDGRAASLDDVIEQHGDGGTISDDERGDLVAYLRSL